MKRRSNEINKVFKCFLKLLSAAAVVTDRGRLFQICCARKYILTQHKKISRPKLYVADNNNKR